MKNLNQIVLRFREANLKINPKKCNLFGKQVKYLSHIVSAKGGSTEPEKTAAVACSSEQKTGFFRSFLRFCSYYKKFVRGFSVVAKPLYVLRTKQNLFGLNNVRKRLRN